MAVLTNLASMQRAFYRLTDTAADDDSLIEHDDSTLEGVNQFLQYGLNDAQDYMMDCGLSDRWVSQATAITSWSGTESDRASFFVRSINVKTVPLIMVNNDNVTRD